MFVRTLTKVYVLKRKISFQQLVKWDTLTEDINQLMVVFIPGICFYFWFCVFFFWVGGGGWWCWWDLGMSILPRWSCYPMLLYKHIVVLSLIVLKKKHHICFIGLMQPHVWIYLENLNYTLYIICNHEFIIDFELNLLYKYYLSYMFMTELIGKLSLATKVTHFLMVDWWW